MKNKILITSVLALLIATSLISAFGVASPYWDHEPESQLVMNRGSTTTVNLNLQNTDGNEDVLVKAKLLEGEEITSLPKEEYLVKVGTHDTMVPLKITLPEDIEAGTVQKIAVEFKTMNTQSGGVALGTGMTISFNVVAGEDIKEKSPLIWIVLGIIAIVIIIALIAKLACKKRKK
jgi:hypothetical protein